MMSALVDDYQGSHQTLRNCTGAKSGISYANYSTRTSYQTDPMQEVNV